jgi:hypothetical protein
MFASLHQVLTFAVHTGDFWGDAYGPRYYGLRFASVLRTKPFVSLSQTYFRHNLTNTQHHEKATNQGYSHMPKEGVWH